MTGLLTIENAVWILIAAGIVAIIALTALDILRRRGGRRDIPPKITEAEEEDDILKRRLRASNLAMNPYVFVVLVFLLALAASYGVLYLFDGMLLPGLITFVVVAYILYNIVLEAAQFRALKFETKLVDAIDLLIGALSSGENPTQAMQTVADLADHPIRAEFHEIANRLKVGMPIRRALGRLLDYYDCEGVRLFANTLSAKWAAGGNFASVLGVVNRIIRERLRYRVRLQSQLSGARVSAIIVAASPYLLVLAFQWRNPEWIRLLLQHPLGPILLFGAIGLQVLGFVLMRRMIRVTL